jgi:hypothetical protein
MRTTCQKCKKGRLIIVREFEQTRTVTFTERVREYGATFDSEGVPDGAGDQDIEHVNEDELDCEEDDRLLHVVHVKCGDCGAIHLDHPLTTDDYRPPADAKVAVRR